MAEQPVEEPIAIEPLVEQVIEQADESLPEPVVLEVPEAPAQKSIMDIVKNIFDTMDSASLITFMVVLFGCLMMVLALVFQPEMFIMVAAIALALIGGFTGVHVGVKATLNTAGLAPVEQILKQLPAVFVEAIPMAIEALTKISEANNVAQTPAPPLE